MFSRAVYILVLLWVAAPSYAHEPKNVREATECSPKILAKQLFPNDPMPQAVFEQLIAAIHLHKKKDPFLAKAAPTFSGFGMDRVPMLFVVKALDGKSELLLLNAAEPLPAEFEKDVFSTNCLGLAAYRIKNVEVERLTTEGADWWDYVVGTGFPLPTPAGKYPDSHFLRRAFEGQLVPLLNLGGKILKDLPVDEQGSLGDIGGQRVTAAEMAELFTRVIVHESYHVAHLGSTHRTSKAGGEPEVFEAYLKPENSAAIAEFVKNPDGLQRAVASFRRAGLLAAESLEAGKREAFLKYMGLARALLARLKKQPEFWDYYRHNEEVEGAAEFAASQTSIDLGIRTFVSTLSLQTDNPNAAFYQTGAMGGWIGRREFGTLPWRGDASDRKHSVWDKLFSQYAEGTIPVPIEAELDKFLRETTEREVNESNQKIIEHGSQKRE